MELKIRVIPNSKKESIEKKEDLYIIKIKEKAEKGKANKRVIEVIAEYFNIKKNKVKIKRGLKDRNKIIEIKD